MSDAGRGGAGLLAAAGMAVLGVGWGGVGQTARLCKHCGLDSAHCTAQLRPRLVLLCRCITDIPNECANDHGGCWHADFKIKGQARSFSACKDNLPAYKVGWQMAVLFVAVAAAGAGLKSEGQSHWSACNRTTCRRARWMGGRRLLPLPPSLSPCAGCAGARAAGGWHLPLHSYPRAPPTCLLPALITTVGRPGARAVGGWHPPAHLHLPALLHGGGPWRQDHVHAQVSGWAVCWAC